MGHRRGYEREDIAVRVGEEERGWERKIVCVKEKKGREEGGRREYVRVKERSDKDVRNGGRERCRRE